MEEGEYRNIDAHEIKKGTFIILDNEPCKVVDIKWSAPGKHGHAKARITAIGLFTGKKKELVKPSGEKLQSPIIDKRQAQVISISDNKVQVMDLESYETIELDKNPDVEVKENQQITYWVVMGKKLITK